MTKKLPQYIKIPTKAAIFFSLLLLVTSFFAGAYWLSNSDGIFPKNSTNVPVFASEKNEKPQLDFYVMSFCPYGNQIEEVIAPVAKLLGDKAVFQPRYIFDKIENLQDYCQSRSGDPTQCDLYVQNNYFPNISECQKTINDNLKACQNEKDYIKSSEGVYYGALHGRQEANQNIREICAWNQVEDKNIWWDFISLVNKNCTSENADNCWQDQAQQAGLDVNKITECFNKQAVDLIEKEIALTTENQVQGSPTVFVNGVSFPPESAYTQDGQGKLKIGREIFNQADFRTPNVIKESVCSSFKKTPKECKTILENTSLAAPAAGGC